MTHQKQTTQIFTEFPEIAGVDMPIKCRKPDINFPVLVDFSNLIEDGFSIYSNDVVYHLDSKIEVGFWDQISGRYFVDYQALQNMNFEIPKDELHSICNELVSRKRNLLYATFFV